MPNDEESKEKEVRAVNDGESNTAAREYQVGFGKPPKQTRFRKGQSGNPKGRPRGAKNFSTIMKEELQQRVLVRENGRQKSIPKLRAIAKQLVNRAASGDHRAIRTLMDYDAGEQKRAGALPPPDERQNETDQAVIAGLLDRLKNTTDEEGGTVDEKAETEE